ncbi:tRNA (N6-threonylcarbamoyladenosine(37)-N6)-methyltransferase TrmO [Streptomyces sp. NPDC002076]
MPSNRHGGFGERSGETDREQSRHRAPGLLSDRYAPALDGLAPGTDVLLLTWLDRAERDTLSVHPRGDTKRPLTGVFATRAPDRPNPIGLHTVRILAIVGTRVHVRNLEALDSTPILDVKPLLTPDR